MIMKKSKIVIFSVFSTILVWGAWGLGVSVGGRSMIADRVVGEQINELPESNVRVEPDDGLERLVSAIYWAEGSSKAKYAYGIQSVKYSSKAKARQACEETIINNYSRWIAKGCPGEYLEYLSKIYCPHNSKVWLKNVKYFLTKDKVFIR